MTLSIHLVEELYFAILHVLTLFHLLAYMRAHKSVPDPTIAITRARAAEALKKMEIKREDTNVSARGAGGAEPELGRG